ncbi:MAG: holin family protein [Gemmobacter sp.]
MGLIGKVFGAPQAVATLGAAVRDVAEVFTPNATAEAAAAAAQAQAALAQHAAEFGHAGSRFDRLVDGLNRLPRPALALGTLGLFVHAMADPAGFAVRMQGLAYVPEPLWWLLGAIVAFYFGAREAHYIRIRAQTPPAPPPVAPPPHSANPALDEWHRAAAER